jgi:hypothetical protein
MEQLRSHVTNFHEISYWKFLLETHQIQIQLKSGKNNRYNTLRTIVFTLLFTTQINCILREVRDEAEEPANDLNIRIEYGQI